MGTRPKRHTYGELNEMYFVVGKKRLAIVVVINNSRNLLINLLAIAGNEMKIEGVVSTLTIFNS